MTLALNVEVLVADKYRDQDNMTNRLRMLARDSGLTLSTVQRVIDGSTGATIDTIERLAHALGSSAAKLLTPETHDVRTTDAEGG